MGIFFSQKAKRVGGIAAGACLLTLILLNAAGYFLDGKSISVFAAAAEINRYEVRSELLMEAVRRVGVCSPEDAARVWADGLKTRSAALQYSVMRLPLQNEYARQLEKTAPNWVTGVSSPWIDGYQIIRVEDPAQDCRIVKMRFFTETSTGPAGKYEAILTLKREDAFWRIAKISMDEGLYPYTGFKPEG